MMKYWYSLLALLFVAGCASAPQPKGSPRDKWINVTDAHNKVVAAFNQNDGQVQYYSDPKEAFETLLAAFSQYQATCKPVAPVTEPAKKVDAKKVKKEEKKDSK